MKYINYNKETGLVLGWYDSEIHSVIPEPNKQIKYDVYSDAIENNFNYFDEATDKFSNKDFRTFDELKKSKISNLTNSYNNEINKDIAYMNTTFQAGPKSRGTLIEVLSVGSVPEGFVWLDKENNQVSMTYTDLQGLSGSILLRGQQNFMKLHSLKENVKTSTDIDELTSIVW